jgi:hypothetical protein
MRALLVALMFLLLGNEADAQSRQPPQESAAAGRVHDSAAEQRDSDTEAEETAPTPVSEPLTAAEYDQKAASKNAHNAHNAHSDWIGDPIVWLTIGLLGAAFAQVLISRNVAINQMRAYIKVEFDGLTTFLDIPKQARLTIRNKGQTPAHEVMAHCWAEVRPLPLHPNAPWIGAIPEGPHESVILHGGDTHPLEPYQFPSMTSSQVEAIEAGVGWRLFVFGEVTYKDVFFGPFRDRRRTEFCFMVGTESDGNLVHLHCEQHNSAT